MPVLTWRRLTMAECRNKLLCTVELNNKMVYSLLAAIDGTAVELCLSVKTAQAGGQHGPKTIVTVITVQ